VTSTSLRRHKATGLVVLLAGLVATGVGYAAVTGTAEAAPTTASAAVIVFALLRSTRSMVSCASCMSDRRWPPEARMR
jgi:hypothetical protein